MMKVSCPNCGGTIEVASTSSHTKADILNLISAALVAADVYHLSDVCMMLGLGSLKEMDDGFYKLIDIEDYLDNEDPQEVESDWAETMERLRLLAVRTAQDKENQLSKAFFRGMLAVEEELKGES